MELNNKIRGKKIFQLWQFESPFFACVKNGRSFL